MRRESAEELAGRGEGAVKASRSHSMWKTWALRQSCSRCVLGRSEELCSANTQYGSCLDRGAKAKIQVVGERAVEKHFEPGRRIFAAHSESVCLLHPLIVG